MNFLSNHGEIGETLTWIGAFFIIFFLILVFLSAAVALAGSQRILEAFSQKSTSSNTYLSGSYEVQRDLARYLSSSIVSDMGEESVSSFIGRSEGVGAAEWSLLQSSSRDFFGQLYGDIPQERAAGWEFEIYDVTGERVLSYGTWSCMIGGRSPVLVSLLLVEGKKVVLCVEQSSYLARRDYDV